MNKLVAGFVVCMSLMFSNGIIAAPVDNRPAVVMKYDLKVGDILVVEANIGGVTQYIFVMINPDWSTDYVYGGKLYPFPIADLDKYKWLLFERTEF
jgi:hypothetical protein